MSVYTVEPGVLQAQLNDAKDALIARINKEHNLAIPGDTYILVVHEKGWLGRVWDRLHPGAKDAGLRVTLLRVQREMP